MFAREFPFTPSMPVSSIAQIFIRLYSIKLFVSAFASFGGLYSIARGVSFDPTYFLIGSIPNILIIVCAVSLWIFAPIFSKWLTSGGNELMSLPGIKPAHLYTAVFLGLGVYFVMDSFSNVIGWIHYFAINHSEGAGGFHMDDQPSYYDLTERLLTLFGGIALIMTCRRFAERIAENKKSEQDGDCDAEEAV